MTLSLVFLLFVIYSMIGWLVEVLYCSIREQKFVNRGFLFGPFCPIYGFGSLFIIVLLEPFKYDFLFLFLITVLLAVIVEFVTSWLLETAFSTKWWDYSSYPFNINGRVCLPYSLMFGSIGVVCVQFLHPAVLELAAGVPSELIDTVSGIFVAIMLTDIAATLKTLIHFDRKLGGLKDFLEGLQSNVEKPVWFNERDIRGSLNRLKILSRDDRTGTLVRLASRIEHLFAHTHGMPRIFRAFPSMRHTKHGKQLALFKLFHSKSGEIEFPSNDGQQPDAHASF